MAPKRYSPSTDTGLTDEQIRERISDGLTNASDSNTTKTYRQLLREHFFTFYNILNITLAALLLCVGAYKDLLFFVIVFANFSIGIIQAFSSKRTLDKLALIVAARANVIRNGKNESIHVNEIVLDDIMELKAGDQICADAIMLDGCIEVNESLITGEADIIPKRLGDGLYSGSFVVAGKGRARADKVGNENYANQISKSAKKERAQRSELYNSMNTILRTISYILVPLGILIYYKQTFLLDIIPEESIVKTVAALIGMIPEGLVLLTSVAFVTSVIFLAYDNTLVQNMPGIETLARADVLCMDKTGTLTEGSLNVIDIQSFTGKNYDEVLRLLCGALTDDNATIRALKQKFPPNKDVAADFIIPFSSERKYSGAYFKNMGSWLLGATEFLLPNGHTDILAKASEITRNGIRVLLLAHSDEPLTDYMVPHNLTSEAFIFISDNVRKDASKIIKYFHKYDVDIKIISGDQPETVAYIAKQAGLTGTDKFIDATTLKTDEELKNAAKKYTIFGRVSPDQKKDIISHLKEIGKTTAMLGDGINDVLALKESNCGIAVASGSDAAKNVSDIVLMDSNLSHLLHAVEDGRKVINNVQRVSVLFITKTVYSVLLAFATLFLFDSAYPFTPIQLVFIATITIGAPSFFLALEPQYERIRGNFIKNVADKSMPGGICIMVGILIINALADSQNITPRALSTMCMYIAVSGGLIILFKVSKPFTTIRTAVFLGMCVLTVACTLWANKFFEIYTLTINQIVLLTIICGCMIPLIFIFEKVISLISGKLVKINPQHKIAKKLKNMFKIKT